MHATRGFLGGEALLRSRRRDGGGESGQKPLSMGRSTCVGAQTCLDGMRFRKNLGEREVETV